MRRYSRRMERDCRSVEQFDAMVSALFTAIKKCVSFFSVASSIHFSLRFSYEYLFKCDDQGCCKLFIFFFLRRNFTRTKKHKTQTSDFHLAFLYAQIASKRLSLRCFLYAQKANKPLSLIKSTKRQTSFFLDAFKKDKKQTSE